MDSSSFELDGSHWPGPIPGVPMQTSPGYDVQLRPRWDNFLHSESYASYLLSAFDADNNLFQRAKMLIANNFPVFQLVSLPDVPITNQLKHLLNLINITSDLILKTVFREHGDPHVHARLARFEERAWRFFSLGYAPEITSSKVAIVINCLSSTLSSPPTLAHVRAFLVLAEGGQFVAITQASTFAREVFVAQSHRRYIVALVFDRDSRTFMECKFGNEGSLSERITQGVVHRLDESAVGKEEAVEVMARVLAGVGSMGDEWSGLVDRDIYTSNPYPFAPPAFPHDTHNYPSQSSHIFNPAELPEIHSNYDSEDVYRMRAYEHFQTLSFPA